MTVWSVYIIRCADGSLYTGIATDVARRLSEHESGAIGSKYLRGRAPLELVFEQALGDRSLASKIEHRIKKLPRPGKERIIDRTAQLDEWVSELQDFALRESSVQ